MTTTVKDVAAKFAVAAVAVAMVFAAYAPSASAQSASDLEAQIAALLAQIEALQGQTGDTGAAATICPYSWTRDLTQGSTGADVMKLQQFLNADADTRVAAAGAVGSAGMETEYYGPATAAAVSKFQVKYRSEILTPGGLVNPTGYFGPSSRAKANALCVTAPTTPDEDGDEDEDDNDGPVTLQGEASIDEYDVDTGEEDELEEGGEDVPVAELTVSYEDGDAEISRLDIKLAHSGSVDPWDVFESFTLWVDGDEVASADAGDDDDYRGNDDVIRFSGINLVVEEDEEVTIVIAATAQNSIDSSDQTGTWTLTVDSMRWFDADGVAETENAASGNATFTVEEAGFEEELTFREADDNPVKATVIVEEDTARTRNVEILRYEIEAEGGDIELNELAVSVMTGTAFHADVIDKLWIEIDGDKFDAEEALAAATTTATYTFDVDGDVVVDEDDTVEVSVMVDFKGSNSGANFASGETIEAEVTGADRDATKAEGADDLGTSQLKGAAVGEEMTLASIGLVAMIDEDDITASDSNDGKNVTFKFVMEVQAIEGDYYISDNGATAISGTVTGATSSAAYSISSNATKVGNAYRINDGQTRTVTVSVMASGATTSGFVKAVLDQLHYGTTSGTPTGMNFDLGAPDFESDDETIVAN